jgi:hypothetical protein
MCGAISKLHRNMTRQMVQWLDHIEAGGAADQAPQINFQVLKSDPQLRACLMRTVMRDAHRVRRGRKLATDFNPDLRAGIPFVTKGSTR